jgi:hypothetical protein
MADFREQEIQEIKRGIAAAELEKATAIRKEDYVWRQQIQELINTNFKRLLTLETAAAAAAAAAAPPGNEFYFYLYSTWNGI